MGTHQKIDAKQAWKRSLDRVAGSAPWLKLRERSHFKVKVFRSGNSLAVRLPAATDLLAGMEMNLTVEDGQFLSLEPIDPPRRKFDVGKVCGSATSLSYIDEDDREFEVRPLSCDEASDK